MKAFALFENNSIKCRVVVTYNNGKVESKDFDKVSDLVNYCNENGLDIPIGSCKAIEAIPNFKIEED